jgi:hypothetical protein
MFKIIEGQLVLYSISSNKDNSFTISYKVIYRYQGYKFKVLNQSFNLNGEMNVTKTDLIIKEVIIKLDNLLKICKTN